MVNSDFVTDGTLVVDIDGTLCDIKKNGQSYSDLIPNKQFITKLYEYKKKGYKITLFTSRNMRTYKNNLGEINKYTAPILFDWLQKWKIPYDEILFGKPWPNKKGFYVDDKAIRPDEFLNMSENEIHKLIGSDE
ncbi:HAD hydrolase family protein [uncultured Prochlorococcus sp.]|uniref:HAD hydrolase family protein n=1 Tax=uncultured Prochlorococcus sp. TaxID=159733 RepID=UPI0025881E24|nr:HAD hydrolase family protein [uncultured Prochlorococcus sp.]